MRATGKARPNPLRPLSVVVLSSCDGCSRVVERTVLNEYGRDTPFEDGGTYTWTHRHTGGVACDCECPKPNPDCEHPTCPRTEPLSIV